MLETIVPHDDEEQDIEEPRDAMKPLVKFDVVQQVDKEDTMDPATTDPGGSPAVNNIIGSTTKADLVASDSGDDDAKKHVGCQSEDGSGTASQLSEPSIKDQESELVEGLDQECDITTSQVSGVAQEPERGLSGFDLNEEFCFEEKAECSLSGTHSDSKQRSVCLDIDLNVSDDNEDKDAIVSSVDACPYKPTLLHLDLNMCQSTSQSCSSPSSSSSNQSSMKNFDLNSNMNAAASLDHQKAVISLFGTQVEVNQGDSFAPGSSMYHYSSPYGPLGTPTGYMVDPRGAPLAPPFVTNMAGGSYSGPTGAGPLQQNIGLNLGLMMNEGNNSGLPGSVVGGKRMEPDGGWEAFAVNYRHQHPPWK